MGMAMVPVSQGMKSKCREADVLLRKPVFNGQSYQIELPFSFSFIYLRERQRDRECVGEGQREGDTEPEAGSRLQAVSTDLS